MFIERRNFVLQVSRLRLLGDHVHSTRIAFVEFVMVNIKKLLLAVYLSNKKVISLWVMQAESAIIALDCCGEILGSQRIR